MFTRTTADGPPASALGPFRRVIGGERMSFAVVLSRERNEIIQESGGAHT